MTDKQIIIDASKCEWRTGVEHCGNYECMLNKCCDYNCDWYKRRKFEQQLKRKERECEKYKQTLTKIIRFLKEDKKFARYSGYPIVFPSIVIEEIEKILKENDIKISECEVENE